MNTNHTHHRTLAKAKTRTKAATQTLEHLQAHQAALAAMTALPVMIVLWAAASFLGALITNGPLGLVQGWLRAVTGF